MATGKELNVICVFILVYLCDKTKAIVLGIIIGINSPLVNRERLGNPGAFSFMMLRIFLDTMYDSSLTLALIIMILLSETYISQQLES